MVCVPLRHLQDKGYNSNGEHLGYIGRIDYPDGTNIDYVNGTLTIDGMTYQMGFDDNYKTVNGFKTNILGRIIQNKKKKK